MPRMSAAPIGRLHGSDPRPGLQRLALRTALVHSLQGRHLQRDVPSWVHAPMHPAASPPAGPAAAIAAPHLLPLGQCAAANLPLQHVMRHDGIISSFFYH